MHPSWVLSLSEHVSIASTGRDGLRLESGFGKLEMRGFGSAHREALCRLAYPGCPLGELVAIIESQGTAADRARLFRDLGKLLRRRLLQIHVVDVEHQILTLAPMSELFEFGPATVPEGRFTLSRFAYLHSQSNLLLLESPRSAARIVLRDPRASVLIHKLVEPVSMESLATDLPVETLQPLVCLLNSAHLLTIVNDDDQRAEDQQAGLKFWEFHDLLFHTRSRMGRHDQVVGAAYHWAGVVDSSPAVKQIVAADAIELDRPDMSQLRQFDAPFADVVEQRRSIREYGPQPITAAQLGEFLFRVARIKEVFEVDGDTPVGPIRMEFSSRPFPSAGGLYELEIYPLIADCTGINRGLYHYDPQGHRLLPLAGSEQYCDPLLQRAATAAGIDVKQIQVLLILSARFPRMMWKYASMAYAAILKNVGVVYQTMYLTATAMNLAPCGLGSGDSDIFSQALGSDYYQETSVGEMLLGSSPPDGPAVS